ncbi:MAG TPA: glycine--tRNA ligase subunit beta, partial [Spirochaetes bacterium]|nr:glycine--tRNA ligase subunit beta [Spirochaetota bacterium]
MLENVNFLCEIGTEEIPAGYIPPAIEFMRGEFGKRLKENRIGFDGVDVMATPRRFVILGSGLSQSQSEEEIELKGPSHRAAYDADGNPTRALEGFLKGNGLDAGDVYRRETDKGDYMFARKKLEARPVEALIPEIVEALVKSTHFPKKMRWSDKKIAFPRPIAYFLILFNDRVVPYEIEGITSSNMTRGHYIQHNRMVEIPSIGKYESILESSGVIVDHRKRKETIQASLEKAAADLGGNLVADEELLETVCFLAENPVVATCSFDPDFLEIPDIVLITEMKEHQKYFAVRDREGSLMPNFLVVSNNPVTPNVRAGNERVITARFNDARFFFNEDRKTRLADKVESLKSVLFHKELGTIYQKTERIRVIAENLAAIFNCGTETAKKIERAVLLCKTDLNTAMVFEFTSLQGK